MKKAMLYCAVLLGCSSEGFSTGGAAGAVGGGHGGSVSMIEADGGVMSAAGQSSLDAGIAGAVGAVGGRGGEAGGTTTVGGASDGGTSGDDAGGSAGVETGGTAGAATGGSDVGGAGGADTGGAGGAGGDTSCPTPTTYYMDHDADTYGGTITVSACIKPANTIVVAGDLTTGKWVAKTGDCNDDNNKVFPASFAMASGVGYDTPLGISYDMNCDGVEEPAYAVDVWVEGTSVCTRPVLNSKHCWGSGVIPAGDGRTTPGANDLCGGTAVGCIDDGTTSGPCPIASTPDFPCK